MQEKAYTYADSLSSISKKSTIGDVKIVFAPGLFPTCSVCEKKCLVKTGESDSILTGYSNNPYMPLVCNSCKAIVCQGCVGNISITEAVCNKCGSDNGFSFLLPSISCDVCNESHGLIVDNNTPGIVTYQNIGGMPPGKCFKCNTIYCVKCAINKIQEKQSGGKSGCPKCGGSDIGLFIPGYNGKGALITEMDQTNGRIIVASPETEAGKRAKERSAKSSEVQISPSEKAEVQTLIEKLQSPWYKIWIDKEGAMKRLTELGAKAEDALDAVMDHLDDSTYFEQAVAYLIAVGPAVKRVVPVLIKMLESERSNTAASAALALGHMRSEYAADAVNALVKIYQRVHDESDTGPKCASAIVLFRMKKINSDAVTKAVLEHSHNLDIDASLIPTADFLERVLVIK